MHRLQPKHTKLKEEDAEKILKELNISKVQLPKILITDPALPKDCKVGDVILIERKNNDKIEKYYRVVV